MTATPPAPPTNIESPRPEPLPFRWISQDLKNLVQLAPMSPYTRALLRIKFNRPVPENCTTFEQIEAWLATLPQPAAQEEPTPTRSILQPSTANQNSHRAQIARGEFLTVNGRIEGHNNCIQYWTQEAEVQVPLSVWEEGTDAVEDYVRNYVRDSDYDYGDYDNDDYGDDGGLEIEEDLGDLMAEAEEMIRIRDGEDEDEDDEDEDDE